MKSCPAEAVSRSFVLKFDPKFCGKYDWRDVNQQFDIVTLVPGGFLPFKV